MKYLSEDVLQTAKNLIWSFELERIADSKAF